MARVPSEEPGEDGSSASGARKRGSGDPADVRVVSRATAQASAGARLRAPVSSRMAAAGPTPGLTTPPSTSRRPGRRGDNGGVRRRRHLPRAARGGQRHRWRRGGSTADGNACIARAADASCADSRGEDGRRRGSRPRSAQGGKEATGGPVEPVCRPAAQGGRPRRGWPARPMRLPHEAQGRPRLSRHCGAFRRRVFHRHQCRGLHDRRLHAFGGRHRLRGGRGERAHEDRLPARAVRPQHHRREGDDRFVPHSRHRQ